MRGKKLCLCGMIRESACGAGVGMTHMDDTFIIRASVGGGAQIHMHMCEYAAAQTQNPLLLLVMFYHLHY